MIRPLEFARSIVPRPAISICRSYCPVEGAARCPYPHPQAGFILDNLKLADVRVEIALTRESLRVVVRRPKQFRLLYIVYVFPVSVRSARFVG